MKVAEYQKVKDKVSDTMNENSKCLIINSQFYKRLLWYNVFNMYCHNDKDTMMYCYVETEYKESSESVTFFLHNFIECSWT